MISWPSTWYRSDAQRTAKTEKLSLIRLSRAHCCCQPCTWADAMKVAGIQGAGAAAFSRIVARAIPRDSDAGKIIGGVAEADASFAGAAVRRKLSDKLFDEQTEGYWTGIFYHCCCTP